MSSEGWVFGSAVKLLLEIPSSHTGGPGSAPSFPPGFLHLRETVGGGSGAWVPAVHVGDLDGVLGSRLLQAFGEGTSGQISNCLPFK